MKIVSLDGGLGNQMFQYAFKCALEKKFPHEIVLGEKFSFKNNKTHNGFELETVFGLEIKFCSFDEIRKLAYDERYLIHKLKRKIFGRRKTEITESEENKFRFTEEFFNFKGDIYYKGYWQTPKYFENLKKKIIQDFSFNGNLNHRNLIIFNQIHEFNSVSIHVRRGDYLNHPLFGGICDLDYFRKAINFLNSKLDNLHFFVFSDDPNWCKTNLEINNVKIIDWNIGKNSFLDMHLMSQCKHNIIANSSFSWWGAYLNQNPSKIIIAPSQWKKNMEGTRDLLPKEWIKIKTRSI